MIELLVDPHGSSLGIIDSVSSSAQSQSERFALILFEEIQFVEKHLDSDKKKFFQSFLRDCSWLSRDDNKLSAAASCTWDSTNVSVSQSGHDGALVNSTYVTDSCSSGELHIKCVIFFGISGPLWPRVSGYMFGYRISLNKSQGVYFLSKVFRKASI